MEVWKPHCKRILGGPVPREGTRSCTVRSTQSDVAKKDTRGAHSSHAYAHIFACSLPYHHTCRTSAGLGAEWRNAIDS
eukprot:6194842-Pleurochrysis_carterae.AAC.2